MFFFSSYDNDSLDRSNGFARAFGGLSFAVIIIFLLFLPSINFDAYFNSAVSSKSGFFGMVLPILSAFFILYVVSLKLKFLILHVSKLDLCLFFLLGYFTINRYFIQPDFPYSINYYDFLNLFILYIVLRFLRIESFLVILLTVIASGIIQAIFGNLQFLGFIPMNNQASNLNGSFINSGPFAGFLAICLLFCFNILMFSDEIFFQKSENSIKTQFNLFFYRKSVLIKVSLIGVVFIIAIIPFTFSRAAFLSIFGGCIYSLNQKYLIFNKIKNYLNIKYFSVLFLLSLMFSWGIYYMYSFKKDSANGRLLIWKVSRKIIEDNVLLGVGFDRFQAIYMNYQASYFSKNSNPSEELLADNCIVAFNDFLQFIAENGTLGAVLAIILLSFLFKVVPQKQYIYLKTIVFSILFAFFIFSFFSYPSQILPIKIIVIICLALISSLDTDKYSIRLGLTGKKQIILKILSCTLIVGLLKLLVLNYSFNKNYILWGRANSLIGQREHKQAIIIFKRLYPLFYNNGEFLVNYGNLLASVKDFENAQSLLTDSRKFFSASFVELSLGNVFKNLNRFGDAEASYIKASNMVPNRFLPHYLLAKLYFDFKQFPKAKEKVNYILAKKVKIPSKEINDIQEQSKEILLTINSLNK